MTQTDQQNVPKLRFPGFSEPLSSVKLGEVASFSKGKGISKNDIAPDGTLPCIRYGELYTFYDTIIEDPISRTNVPAPSLTLSKGDEVLVPASGEDAKDIATAVVVKKAGVALGGDLNIIRSKNDGAFLASYLSGRKRMTLAAMAQGNSVVHLYPAQLTTLDIYLPTLPEQRKIAVFLWAVDTKIAQLAEKKRLLEDYKKGCMQQLFSQKIRFKDDDGNDFPDWEEKRLGEVLSIGSGRDYKHLGDGDIPVYGTGGLMTYVDDFLYEGDSVCIGRKGTIDKPVLLTGKFWTVDTLFYTHSFRNALPRFIYAVFQQINWQMHNEASGVPSLSKSTIERLKVSLPHPDEQRKIADFLSALDRKIDLVGQELTHARSFKQGLLQQMFV